MTLANRRLQPQQQRVLLHHKRLRLFVMHAGWPRLDEMLALLYAHPNVYVDVAGLRSAVIVPRRFDF